MATAGRRLNILQLGCVAYETVWEKQRLLQRELIEGKGHETLILCQHPAVITIGRSTKAEDRPADLEGLAKSGVRVVEIERGGSITCHEPGQLVGYPIIDLERNRRDVAWYMRSLEEVMIRTLASLGFEGVRIDGKTGVWVMDGDLPCKIGFVGVRISRWKTMHGFSLNIENNCETFRFINPCGLGAISVKALSELGKNEIDLASVEPVVAGHFCSVFGFS